VITELAGVSRAVSTTSRGRKVAALAERVASRSADEFPFRGLPVGGAGQRRFGVGWAEMRSVPAASRGASLTVLARGRGVFQDRRRRGQGGF